MNITKMEISSREADDEPERLLLLLNNFKKENKREIKNSKLLSYVFQSDSEDDDEAISPENKKKSKNSDMDTISIYSNDSQEEEFQRAIMFSLGMIEQERDTKQKGVIAPCTLSPLSSISTFGSTTEVGSMSSPSTCIICRDVVVPTSFIRILPCCHLSCAGCLSCYLAEHVNLDVRQVACPVPKCDTFLTIDFIYRCLPEEVRGRWWWARLEGSVLQFTLQMMCPFEGCGKPTVDDERRFPIRACTSCWRLFCYYCKAGCHMGMTCPQFMKREEEARRRQMLIIMRREEEIGQIEEDERENKWIQTIKDARGVFVDLGNGYRIFVPLPPSIF